MRSTEEQESGRPRTGGMSHGIRPRPVPAALAIRTLVPVLVALALAIIGCGGGDEVGDVGVFSVPSQTTTTVGESTTHVDDDTTTAGDETMTVNVYYTLDLREMCTVTRVVPKSQEVGAAAMKALLEGPTAEEREAGILTNIPEGTTFLGLTVEDGLATVDLSNEYASDGAIFPRIVRLAEVVFTLTQFPTVDAVNFKLDGQPIGAFGDEGFFLDHPLDRSEYEDLSPAILVESPTRDATVTSPLHVTGTANVFEGAFRINLVDWDGLIIADHAVAATPGTGTHGTFDVTIPFMIDRPGRGALIVFAESPRDGSQINAVEIPLQLKE